jgi:hypothetical protein
VRRPPLAAVAVALLLCAPATAAAVPVPLGDAGLVVETVPVHRTAARVVFDVRCAGAATCAGPRLHATVDGERVGRTSEPVRIASGATEPVTIALSSTGWRVLASRWRVTLALSDGVAELPVELPGGVPGIHAFVPLALEHGPRLDDLARRYRPGLTGAELLLKTLQGESRFRMDAVSRAGARGAAQFMPGSRRIALRRFRLDPWRSREEAVLAMVEHLLGGINGRSGLFGYNPRGSPWYQRYILGQPIPPLTEAPAELLVHTR